MDNLASRSGFVKAGERAFSTIAQHADWHYAHEAANRPSVLAREMQQVEKLERWLNAHAAAQPYSLDPKTEVDALTRVLRGAPWEVKEISAAFRHITRATIDNPQLGHQIARESPMLWKQLTDAAKHHELASMRMDSRGSVEERLDLHGAPNEGRFLVVFKTNDHEQEMGHERTVGVHRTYTAAIADISDRAQPSLNRLREFDMDR